MQAECELVIIDIDCHIQGDIVLECINLHDDWEHENIIFRAMFNTSFIRSNILILNRDEIDMLWDAKDQFPKDFKAEVFFFTFFKIEVVMLIHFLISEFMHVMLLSLTGQMVKMG